MSKMSKIDQIHLRAVMLCMSKMSKIDQMQGYTRKVRIQPDISKTCL